MLDSHASLAAPEVERYLWQELNKYRHDSAYLEVDLHGLLKEAQLQEYLFKCAGGGVAIKCQGRRFYFVMVGAYKPTAAALAMKVINECERLNIKWRASL